MPFAKSYSKELIKQLQQVPVYLPGKPVELGDIIIFGTGPLKSRPFGEYTLLTTLNDLEIDFKTRLDTSPQSYQYSTKRAIDISADANAHAGETAGGKTKISFKKEGAIYFNAVDCKTNMIQNLISVEDKLQAYAKKIDWANAFIVTSVTIAAKALIMQSNDKDASLTLDANLKTPGENNKLSLDAGLNLAVTSHKEATFLVDWTKDVAVFFNLARFKKGSVTTRSLMRAENEHKLEELDLESLEL